MTRIEDMSEPERQSWITLLADGAVFIWFLSKMTIWPSLKPIHTDMEEFGEVILGVVIVTIILHAVIASIFDMRKRKEAFMRDERDTEIARKGSDYGYRVMQWGVGVIVVTMLAHNMIGPTYTPPVRIEKPVEIIFGLLVVSYIADLLKQGVKLHAYRRF